MPNVQPTPSATGGKKLIVVDGPSLDGMKRKMGIARLDFKRLYSILIHEVGSSRVLATTPVVTAHPNRVGDYSGLAKKLRGAGFEILAVESEGGADDRALVDIIERTTLGAASEIVLVTSDKDFIPVVREKLSQGHRIYWVAALNAMSNSSNRCLSRDVFELADRKAITLIDLGRFATDLTDQKRSANAVHDCRAYPERADDATVVTIRLKSPCARDHLDLASEMTRLKSRFPHGFSFTIEQ